MLQMTYLLSFSLRVAAINISDLPAHHGTLPNSDCSPALGAAYRTTAWTGTCPIRCTHGVEQSETRLPL